MNTIFSMGDIPRIAADLKEYICTHKKNDTATVIALTGDLGAGKTTMTQALAKVFGITETLISPTFIIMKNYMLSSMPFERLIHIDAYRLESGNELTKLGWNEILQDPRNFIIIEWPEKVSEVMPLHVHTVSLSHVSDSERRIIY